MLSDYNFFNNKPINKKNIFKYSTNIEQSKNDSF